MDKDQFLSTIKMMGWKVRNSTRYYLNEHSSMMLYSNSAITTINDISKYHSTFENAIKRISKKTDNV